MAGIYKDPICGMDVTYETAQARTEYNGDTYYFCSLECKETFDQDPEKVYRSTGRNQSSSLTRQQPSTVNARTPRGYSIHEALLFFIIDVK